MTDVSLESTYDTEDPREDRTVPDSTRFSGRSAWQPFRNSAGVGWVKRQ